ncbi:MAG: methyltransferase domain-containing protein [Bdellovibrionales bacterium]
MKYETYDESTVCKVSQDGEVIFQEQLIQNSTLLKEFYNNISVQKGNYYSQLNGVPVQIEAQEQILVAKSLFVQNEAIYAEIDGGFSTELNLNKIFVNDWDEFSIFNLDDFPVFIKDKALNAFFNLLDEFDDDSILFNGQKYPTPSYYSAKDNLSEKDWSERYSKGNTGWDMDEHHPFLEDVVPQLKLMKSSIAVMGAGRAHDAAFFASLGHIVTAFDVAQEAIDQAKKLYPETENFKYVKADILKLPEEFRSRFDIVFDHTFYCAISPAQRSELVKVWGQLLHDDGHVMGIFFSMFKTDGPPFGGSERELYLRVYKKYNPLYWNRIRKGPMSRLGKEFFVYLKKM